MTRVAKCFGLALAALGLILGAAGRADADPTLTWDFSYDFPPINFGTTDAIASGTLTTTDVLNPDGSYTITGITGTRTYNGETDTITGLIAPGGFANDNELFPVSPHLNNNGFSYTIDSATNGNAGNQVNVFFDPTPGGGYSEFSNSIGFGSFSLTPAATAVPEPSTLLTSGLLGLTGLGYAWRRKAKAAA